MTLLTSLFPQVYLPTVEGYIPLEMIKALCAFLTCCYIAHHNIHDMTSLRDMQEVLDHFHHHHKYFQECGVHPDSFNLPWQHSLIHYIRQLCAFGAPNDICSSITKFKQ